jgi:ubiquinone biosynthesis protein COQ4
MTATVSNYPLTPPPGCSQPLEIPPGRTPHRLRWRKVLRILRDLRTSEDQVDAGLRLVDAVGGAGGERTFQRFVRQPEGRRLLRIRPDLVSLLADREALAAMPDGSLGRAYLAFAEENGFAADGLMEKNQAFEREGGKSDPHREWFWNRFTLAHDLWHVLTGCAPTAEGEMTLLAFSHAQNPQRGYLFLLGLGTLGNLTQGAAHRRSLRAWRAGKRAASLLTAPWEQLLAWPLAEVRRSYRVGELMQ